MELLIGDIGFRNHNFRNDKSRQVEGNGRRLNQRTGTSIPLPLTG